MKRQQLWHAACVGVRDSAPPPSRTKPTFDGTIGIAIATFQRPGLLERTLRSLEELTFDGHPPNLRLHIVDNDEAGTGARVVEALEAEYRWPVSVQVEPRPGISFARNRAVAALGDCDWLAFIDDDEWAEPRWLAELMARAQQSGADAVLGPVLPELSRPVPNWLSPAFLEDAPLADGADVPPGRFRTGNLLIKRDWLKRSDPPFHPAFALTGGSDSYLGAVLSRHGARFVYAAKAIVHERVPPERISFYRYLKRRFRCGVAYTLQQQHLDGTAVGTGRGLYRGAGSLAVAPVRALMGVSRGSEAWLPAVGLAAYGAGNLTASVGLRYSEYRRKK